MTVPAPQITERTYLNAIVPDVYITPTAMIVNVQNRRNPDDEMTVDLLFTVQPGETEYGAIVRSLRSKFGASWIYTGESSVIE